MKYPKVLVVANNCFSLSNSNGRTLGNLFEGWDRKCLAQFSLSINNPNLEVCDNYFSVSDMDAVRALLGKKIEGKNTNLIKSAVASKTTIGNKRTALRMLVRNAVWNTNRWKKSGFDIWVDNFNPDIVLLQSGDAAFMCDIARSVAKRKKVPLIVFNTEAYYFFNKSWFHNHWTDRFAFPVFRFFYRNSFKRLMRMTSVSIYCNSLLKEDYDKEFETNSPVIYTGSAIKFLPKELNAGNPVFSYLGNLGLNRPYALMEIAEALRQIKKDYVLDVYGKLPHGMEHIFDSCANIKFQGLISYDKVQEVIAESDVLFHAESSEGKYIYSLKYAFSTKIADSLASGSNFVLYAPSFLACSKYVIDNEASWFVEKRSDLVSTLTELINNKTKRDKYISNAHGLAINNHDMRKNVDLFRRIIVNTTK